LDPLAGAGWHGVKITYFPWPWLTGAERFSSTADVTRCTCAKSSFFLPFLIFFGWLAGPAVRNRVAPAACRAFRHSQRVSRGGLLTSNSTSCVQRYACQYVMRYVTSSSSRTRVQRPSLDARLDKLDTARGLAESVGAAVRAQTLRVACWRHWRDLR